MQTSHQFQDKLETPRLDAEILVGAVVQFTRTQLFSHSEKILTTSEELLLADYVNRRLQGEPVALILGYKEFWSLKLKVTGDTLIPRPETEDLVEWILSNFPKEKPLHVADLGVGTGAIALALAQERPLWEIAATDYSEKALAVAKENANAHQLENVSFYQGSWCTALPKGGYDVIVSNPPYIAEGDPHLEQLTYEPYSALASGKDGLLAIKTIIKEAPRYLVEGGALIIEHGFDQSEAVVALMQAGGFLNVIDHNDLAGLARFISGWLP